MWIKKLLFSKNILVIWFILFTFPFVGLGQNDQRQYNLFEKYFVREVTDTLFSALIKLNELLSIAEKTTSQPSIQHYNIWITSLESTFEPVPLTYEQEGECYMPRWSKKGDQILYISTITGSKKIWLMQSDGTGKMQLTRGEDNDEFPLWSPDANKIAFLRNYSLYLIDVKTEVEERLTNQISVQRLCAWTRDGGSIFLISNKPDKKTKLIEFRISDKEPIELESQPDDLYKIFSDLRIHPTKDLVLFEKIEMDSYEVIVRNLKNARQTYISDAYSNDRYPDWSPKGDLIIFSSNRKIPEIEAFNKNK